MPPDHPEIVATRSNGMCEGCHKKRATNIHHRRFLGRGGKHNLANLLALCGSGNHSGCHGLAHSGDAPEGWAISQFNNNHEATIRFVDLDGKPWWLDNSGLRHDRQPQPY